MAEVSTPATKRPARATAKTAARHGERDRVAMLSLRADGTPDQRDPEVITSPDPLAAEGR
jgi:phosphotransacetylase